MSLLQKINSELGTALKSGDKRKLSVLRLLKAAIVNAKISNREELNVAQEISVVKKQAKQTQDAIALYEKNNQPNRAKEEKLELKIIESYLPQEISDTEIESNVTLILNSLDPNLKNNFGKVMGAVMAKLQGKAGGDRVATIVSRKMNL